MMTQAECDRPAPAVRLREALDHHRICTASAEQICENYNVNCMFCLWFRFSTDDNAARVYSPPVIAVRTEVAEPITITTLTDEILTRK